MDFVTPTSLRAAAAFAFLAASACATAPAGEAPAVVAAKPAVPAGPVKPVFVKSQILGRNAGAIDDLLGPAALTRREGAGEFRRYTLARCTLIVILHPDVKGEPRAGWLDAAAKTSGEEKPELEACLAGGKAPAGVS